MENDAPGDTDGCLSGSGELGPRLSRLVATILAAKTVTVTPDQSGRIRLKIDAVDGGTQISLVTEEEAATLRHATNRM